MQFIYLILVIMNIFCLQFNFWIFFFLLFFVIFFFFSNKQEKVVWQTCSCLDYSPKNMIQQLVINYIIYYYFLLIYFFYLFHLLFFNFLIFVEDSYTKQMTIDDEELVLDILGKTNIHKNKQTNININKNKHEQQ